MRVIASYLYEGENSKIKPASITLSYPVSDEIDEEVLKDLLTLEIKEKYGIDAIGVTLTTKMPNYYRQSNLF